MNTYIVIQMINQSEELIGVNNFIKMANIVRRVDAENEAMAIGKFVMDTKGIYAKKKLDIECYDLSILKNC